MSLPITPFDKGTCSVMPILQTFGYKLLNNVSNGLSDCINDTHECVIGFSKSRESLSCSLMQRVLAHCLLSRLGFGVGDSLRAERVPFAKWLDDDVATAVDADAAMLGDEDAVGVEVATAFIESAP